MSTLKWTSVFLIAAEEKWLELHLLIFNPNVAVKQSLATEIQMQML